MLRCVSKIRLMKYRLSYIFGVLLMVIVGTFAGGSVAQSINSSDLSAVRVDELSDEQIRAYLTQATSAGLSEVEMERLAMERGMPLAEVEKLRQRIERLDGASERRTAPVQNRNTEREVIDSLASVPLVDDTLALDSAGSQQLELFGASLFRGVTPIFEPNLRLATPRNYVVGPTDQILIDIYGASEEYHALTVSPEGTITIPYVGVVSVAGMTIEQATAHIESELTTLYSAIRTGETKVSVTLGNIRSIHITVTGEVMMPGTYTLPSVASVFNALYYSGGPSHNGSFRDIRLIRNGEEIALLDIYDVLINGHFSENIRLEDQDVLMIPPYQKRVEVSGEVKRPAIFELKDGETFEDLLNYAGGFT